MWFDVKRLRGCLLSNDVRRLFRQLWGSLCHRPGCNRRTQMLLVPWPLSLYLSGVGSHPASRCTLPQPAKPKILPHSFWKGNPPTSPFQLILGSQANTRTPIKLYQLQPWLLGYNQDPIEKQVTGFSDGFDVEYKGALPHVRLHNLRSALEHPEVVEEQKRDRSEPNCWTILLFLPTEYHICV